jgi:transcriptional regulator with XRE-family HTH domain
MKKDTWRLRLKAAGLTQRDIARRLGWQVSSVTRALDRDPPSAEILAVIEAAEIMTGEQRARWFDHGSSR